MYSPHKSFRFFVAIAPFIIASVVVRADAQGPTPAAYHLSPASDHAITVERGGEKAVYRPVFTVIWSETDPKLALSGFTSTPNEPRKDVNPENYPLPHWQAAKGVDTTDVL